MFFKFEIEIGRWAMCMANIAYMVNKTGKQGRNATYGLRPPVFHETAKWLSPAKSAVGISLYIGEGASPLPGISPRSFLSLRCGPAASAADSPPFLCSTGSEGRHPSCQQCRQHGRRVLKSGSSLMPLSAQATGRCIPTARPPAAYTARSHHPSWFIS